MKFRKILLNCLICIFIFLGLIAFFSAEWYIDKYGDIGFAAILFTLLSPLEGTDSSLIKSWAKYALAPAILFTFISCFFILFHTSFYIAIEHLKTHRLFRIYPFPRITQLILTFALTFALLFQAAETVGIPEWLVQTLDKSTIYEDKYVDPDTVNISFPSEKRNLIVTIQYPVKGTLIFGQNRENKISVSSSF